MLLVVILSKVKTKYLKIMIVKTFKNLIKPALLAIIAYAFLVNNVSAQSANITVPSSACQGPYYNCSGGSFTLAVSITGLQPPYKYLWTGGATTSTVTVTTDTLIRVRVKGTNSQGLQEMVYSPWRNFKFLQS